MSMSPSCSCAGASGPRVTALFSVASSRCAASRIFSSAPPGLRFGETGQAFASALGDDGSLEVKAGRPQIHGTQLSFHDGRWLLDPIADSINVDHRRRRMGMMPLREYLRKADSALRAP
jgi:hypothetical protein